MAPGTGADFKDGQSRSKSKAGGTGADAGVDEEEHNGCKKPQL